MKYILLLFFLTSCSSIQEAANINALKDESAHYDGIVKILNSASEASTCEFVSSVRGEDNLIHLGKNVAITNMKKFAVGKKANAILVEECMETRTAISPISTCSGKAYKCSHK